MDTRCPVSLFKSRACFTRKALGAPASALHDIFHSDLPESFCRPVLGVHLQTRLEDEKQRLLALAAVHDVMNRSEAARIGGMDRQTLRDGVVRWRCVDLKRVLGQRFGVDLSEVSLGRALKELVFSHISADHNTPSRIRRRLQILKNFPTRRS